MKSLEEQDHYEVLELSRSATFPEIQRAYHMLQSTYVPNSLALYSVFDEVDSLALKERIELAYRVLADADTRRAYDAEVDGWGVEQDAQLVDQETIGQSREVAPHREVLHAGGNGSASEGGAGGEGFEPTSAEGREPRSVEVQPGIESFQDLEGDADEGEDFDGPRLRRARLRRGIEIDQISDVTKVSRAFLRGLEEEAYDELPAPVYVRGFVIAYARAIGLGLDAKSVAKSYMARLEASKLSRPRGRLLGRL
jgi:flagellar biosynthesis protein FlhG